MSHSDKHGRRGLDEVGEGGLKHNPFAALSAGQGSSKARDAGSPAAAGSAAEPSGPRGRDAASAPGPSGTEAVGGGARVWHERKGRGGKTVTLLEFDSALPSDGLATVARRMAKALGSGARAQGATVLVQGDARDRVVRFAEEHLGCAVRRGT